MLASTGPWTGGKKKISENKQGFSGKSPDGGASVPPLPAAMESAWVDSQGDGKALSASNTARWNASCTLGFPLTGGHVEARRGPKDGVILIRRWVRVPGVLRASGRRLTGLLLIAL